MKGAVTPQNRTGVFKFGMTKGSMQSDRNPNNTLGFDKVSLDHEYDTSKLGPGSYDHFATFDK